MTNSMRYFELEDDLSDILEGADDEPLRIPRYEPIIPTQGDARDRFVRATAKHLSILRPGLRITVLDWERMLDAAFADTYTDAVTGRVVTMRDIR
ncbi:MAG: hypothetical protein CFE29_08880 [Bradyrhizobiaceae bacterium PARB1]|jgi:hypothetical protein|nr:MAG: hypothetical protein CFE29_08880 [Bradyrhizobiaceae bacterium PARB1]